MLVYRYVPLCVKLIVSSRGRDSASADASGSGRPADGCKLYPSGAAVFPRYAEDCSFYRSTGTGPAGRAVYTGACCVSLPSHVRHREKNVSGYCNLNSSTDRQVCRQRCGPIDATFYGATNTTKQQLRHRHCQRNLNTPQNNDSSYIKRMRAHSETERVPPSHFERVLSACRAPMLNAPP